MSEAGSGGAKEMARSVRVLVGGLHRGKERERDVEVADAGEVGLMG